MMTRVLPRRVTGRLQIVGAMAIALGVFSSPAQAMIEIPDIYANPGDPPRIDFELEFRKLLELLFRIRLTGTLPTLSTDRVTTTWGVTLVAPLYLDNLATGRLDPRDFSDLSATATLMASVHPFDSPYWTLSAGPQLTGTPSSLRARMMFESTLGTGKLSVSTRAGYGYDTGSRDHYSADVTTTFVGACLNYNFLVPADSEEALPPSRFRCNFDSAIVTVTGSAIPEPANWAMMITGFGVVGGALRRRRWVMGGVGLPKRFHDDAVSA